MKWWRLLFPFGKPDIKIEVVKPSDSTENMTRAESKEAIKLKRKLEISDNLSKYAVKAGEIADQINALVKHNYIMLSGELIKFNDDHDGAYAKVWTHTEEVVVNSLSGETATVITNVNLSVYRKLTEVESIYGEHGTSSYNPFHLPDHLVWKMVVDAPPAWVEIIEEMRDCISGLKGDLRLLKKTVGGLQHGHQINLMLFEHTLKPVIKFYADQSWITHGWEGPAIVPLNGEDQKVGGLIPSSVDLYNYEEHIFPQYRNLFNHPVFLETPVVVRYKAEALRLYKELEDLVNDIQYNQGHRNDSDE